MPIFFFDTIATVKRIRRTRRDLRPRTPDVQPESFSAFYLRLRPAKARVGGARRRVFYFIFIPAKVSPMKCPKCQREHTLKRAENNTVVCAACGSRFSLKTPAKPAAPQPQPSPAPPVYSPNEVEINKFSEQREVPNIAPKTPSQASTPTPPFSQNEALKTASSLFSWSGRSTAKEFLIAFAYYLGAVCAVCVTAALVPSALRFTEDSSFFFTVATVGMLLTGVVFSFFLLVFHVMLFASATRRFRDAGFSPWATLLYLIPPVAPLLTLALALLPSRKPDDSSALVNVETSTSVWRQLLAFSLWKRLLSSKEPSAPNDWPFAVGVFLGALFWVVAFFLYDKTIDTTFIDVVYADIKWESSSETWTGYKFLKFTRPCVYSSFILVNLATLALLVKTRIKSTRK